MINTNIHLDEANTVTVDIFKLLYFIKEFFIPYKKFILITTVLAFCVIGTDLMLPQLLKVALDRYISVTARRVILKGKNNNDTYFQSHYSCLCVPSDIEGQYYILPDSINKINEKEIRRFEKDGLLSPDKFYVTQTSPEKEKLLYKYRTLIPGWPPKIPQLWPLENPPSGTPVKQT